MEHRETVLAEVLDVVPAAVLVLVVAVTPPLLALCDNPPVPVGYPDAARNLSHIVFSGI